VREQGPYSLGTKWGKNWLKQGAYLDLPYRNTQFSCFYVCSNEYNPGPATVGKHEILQLWMS
jgi:hypothetical protein